jgi:hypothetical protein
VILRRLDLLDGASPTPAGGVAVAAVTPG